MRIPGIFAFFLLALAIAFPAAAELAPCSERYAHPVEYTLTPDDIGKDPRQVLSRWQLSGPSWGWERISIVEGEPHKAAIQVFYPAGSINPANKLAPRGGASFYAHQGFVPPVTAACLHYRVFFPSDFAFGKGGKMPGLYGGRNEKGESASGCRPGIEQDAFSTRYMWRENGAGSLYAYIPGKTEKCGEYIGKGSWHFIPGQWTTLEQEVVLNTPGQSNGTMRVWVNGKLVIDQPNRVLIKKAGIPINGVFFVSFFGGKEPEWASPKDQAAEFSDVAVFFP